MLSIGLRSIVKIFEQYKGAHMGRTEQYRAHLQQMCEWESYLLAESRLPGARANLELARAVAEEGDRAQFDRWLRLTVMQAPTNTPAEFLPFCAVIGYGRLLAQGDRSILPELWTVAEDPRWRLREAVAMALQCWGDVEIDGLVSEMAGWCEGGRYQQRAALVALCEPTLLNDSLIAQRTLEYLDRVTATIPGTAARHDAGFIVLRKALGYCWSVAIVAAPELGMPLMTKWAMVDDPDTRWLVRENLAKPRLRKLDNNWVTGLMGNITVPT